MRQHDATLMREKSIKIFSLNIELDRHFDRIIPFIHQYQPQVVLLQEVLNKDIPYLEEALDMKCEYAPIIFWSGYKDLLQLGMATFSKLPMTNVRRFYYRGDPDNLPILEPKIAETVPRAILVTDHRVGADHFCFVNTHFTWSPNGQPSQNQHQDLENLLGLLEKMNSFVMCGDFNAPRGTAIFDTLARKYQDNIPAHITTTIDKNLHRAGDLNLMVDGLFSTKDFRVTAVEVMDGLSDHMAVMAEISKIKD